MPHNGCSALHGVNLSSKKNISKKDTPFHSRAYNYSHVDWDGLCGHLKDVSWEDISEIDASATGTDFVSWSRMELMYISLIINISFSCT